MVAMAINTNWLFLLFLFLLPISIYLFITVISFILIFSLTAIFSVDAYQKTSKPSKKIPRWNVDILKIILQ
jgi:hypothetical protein